MFRSQDSTLTSDISYAKRDDKEPKGTFKLINKKNTMSRQKTAKRGEQILLYL